jgi:class 3 adenylate cyclase
MVAVSMKEDLMTEVDLEALLDDIDGDVATELSCKPDVVDKGHDLDLDKLPIDARKWHKLTDAVAVVADLKNSTQLGLNKHAASTASIYEASTGGVVQIFDEFDADFVAIQGDGAFGLFWGDKRRERAVCAGVTIKTFSAKHLVPRLEKKWPELPVTGLKVGMANSPLLVKRVGVPRTDHQEPVWAGRAVNYAAKAAQQADRHQMIVTGAIWDWASDNDYLAVSCPCPDGPSSTIWSDVTIEKIPDGDGDREGKLLTPPWCGVHGPDYCDAILAGQKQRTDVTTQRTAALQEEMKRYIRAKARESRQRRTARRVGLR